jgi:predicted TIM-barrel fold metal-dependent hydrolase
VRALLWLLIAGLAVTGAAGPARAEPLPLFDAHIHYSQPDWGVIPPERAVGILKSANVRRAIVSSTPDDGTLRLWEKDPALVVPFLRPYRTPADMSGWPRDPAVAAYVEARLARGIYKGLGEFHLSADDVEAPVVRRLAELAARQDLFLQPHVDDAVLERLLTVYPRVNVLWAHAGMSASPASVGRLLDRSPRLWVELSLRSDVAPGGILDAEWRALFLRHPDRFLIGTDTWATHRWEALPDWLRQVQAWLAQLPRDVAERIAYRNGERLFIRP